MPLNPWDNDENSLETGNPVSNAAKAVTNAVVKPTAAQLKADQTFVDQLYGNVTPSEDSGDPAAVVQKAQSAAGANPQQAASATGLQGPAMPEDQAKLEETRKKLESLHHKNYYEPTFGEEAQRKRQQEEEQEKQMKEQEEQEKLEMEAQEKQQQAQEMGSFGPQGKASGQPGGRGKAVMKPLSVMQSQTKTESNRGSTG